MVVGRHDTPPESTSICLCHSLPLQFLDFLVTQTNDRITVDTKRKRNATFKRRKHERNTHVARSHAMPSIFLNLGKNCFEVSGSLLLIRSITSSLAVKYMALAGSHSVVPFCHITRIWNSR